MASHVASVSNFVCSMTFLPALNRASSGQGWNQSMTVQFTRAGNLRRLRKSSPRSDSR